jgi:hypothetical protein
VPNPANDHGPFETESQALAAPAVRAAYRAHEVGTTSLRDGAADLLLSACERAGATLGAYDRRILLWLAGFEPQAAAAVAEIIVRAAARSPHEIAFDLDDDYVLTYICLAESLQTWGAIQRWLAGVEGGNRERELLSAHAAEMLTAVEAAIDGNSR